MVPNGRLKTGIPGVDEMTFGGLPENTVTIVSGPPGIGKTNFAMQFVYKGLEEYGDPAVYLTVEDPSDVVKSHARVFGWDLSKYEDDGKLIILSQSNHGYDLSAEPRDTLGEAISRIGARRLVLDSLTFFKYMFKDTVTQRINFLNFIKEVKDTGCTALFTSEQHEGGHDIVFQDEHFLADGLIQLFWNRHRERNERCFRVVKMRGTRINPDIRPMDITDKGVVVFPTQVPLSL
ncbi:MAG: ATPase domain-containing protein, partial [Candidatus Altiarchaeota archaeon]